MPDRPRSHGLPPPEAWKHPDRWFDQHTNYVKKGVKRITLEADERDFLFPESVVTQLIDELFWEDYNWPYSPDDPTTKPDNHHMHYERRMYEPGRFDGDTTAQDFRELPTLIGRMPRQMHIALHRLTETPAMPELDAMREYLDSFNTAKSLFTRLYETVEKTLVLSRLFARTNLNLEIDNAILQSTFARSFADYSQLVEQFEQQGSIMLSDGESDYNNLLRRPGLVHQKLGYLATRRSVDLMPKIMAA